MISELLALLADAYIPLLALVLVWLLYSVYKNSKNIFSEQLLLFGLLLSIVYGFMFLDKAYKIWPSVGLDYSTHSALFSALIFCVYAIKPTFKYMLCVLLLSYSWMLIYLKYHTLLDILSTIGVIFFCYVFIVLLRKKSFNGTL